MPLDVHRHSRSSATQAVGNGVWRAPEGGNISISGKLKRLDKCLCQRKTLIEITREINLLLFTFERAPINLFGAQYTESPTTGTTPILNNTPLCVFRSYAFFLICPLEGRYLTDFVCRYFWSHIMHVSPQAQMGALSPCLVKSSVWRSPERHCDLTVFYSSQSFCLHITQWSPPRG